jgi:four helix bundle protein
MANKGHQALRVWQAAIALVERVDAVTSTYPTDERFGFTAQARRAADAVPSNIAEGRGQGSDLKFARHCSIAYGTAMEVETQLKLTRRLGFQNEVAASELGNLTGEVGCMLNARRSSFADARRPTPGG